MLRLSAAELSAKPAVFRYFYFIFSSFKLKSFSAWQKAGEPNPFVGKTYRQHATERIEFVDIFGEDLDHQRPHRQQD